MNGVIIGKTEKHSLEINERSKGHRRNLQEMHRRVNA